MQAKSGGQTPLQVGAPALEQGTGVFTHWQPVADGTHFWLLP
jgi:hypothetical protein